MQPASAGLEKIFRDLLARVPVNEQPVLAWPLICGPGVSKMTRAVGFGDGVLQVEVADLNWKIQLAELAPRYVASFAEMLGGVVARIDFVLAGAPVKEERKDR